MIKRSILSILVVLVMAVSLSAACAETILSSGSIGSANGQTIMEMLNGGQVAYVTVP